MKVFCTSFFLLLLTYWACAVTSPAEIQALTDFYTDFNGPGWSNSTGWLSGDPCINNWFGVSCDGLDRVTSLVLNLNSLQFNSGPLPDLNLPFLQTLDLNNNNFFGATLSTFPSAISLDFINLSNSQLGGTIPSFPQNLTTFFSGYNRHCGTLPIIAPAINTGLPPSVPSNTSNLFNCPLPGWCATCRPCDDCNPCNPCSSNSPTRSFSNTLTPTTSSTPSRSSTTSITVTRSQTPSNTRTKTPSKTKTPTATSTIPLILDTISIDEYNVDSLPIIISGDSILPITESNFTQSMCASGNILGCERDIILRVDEALSGSQFMSSVSNGMFNLNIPNGGGGSVSIQYDGEDSNVNLDTNGLNNDLTMNGGDRFIIELETSHTTDITILVYSSTNNICEIIFSTIGVSILEIPFFTISGSCSFQNVGAIEISIDFVDNLIVNIESFKIGGVNNVLTPSSSQTSSISLSPSNTFTPTSTTTFTPSSTTSMSSSRTSTTSMTSTFTPSPSYTSSNTHSSSITPTQSDSSTATVTPVFEFIQGEINPSTVLDEGISTSNTPSKSMSKIPIAIIEISKSQTNTLVPVEEIELQNCVNCVEQNSITVPIQNEENNEIVGSVEIPEGTLQYGTIDIQILNEIPNSNTEQLAGIITDINLFDEFGLPIHSLQEEIKICLQSNETQKQSDLCLGYFEVEDNQWKCQDKCLKENSEGLFCGNTDHLTSFALLLNGIEGDCDDDEVEYIITWMSLGFVGIAIIFIVIGIFLIEIRMRIIQRKNREEMKRITDTISNNQ